MTEGQKDKEPKQYIRGNTACARACSLSKQSGERKARNKSAQGNALGIVRNQHSPRMGKRIIISPTPLPLCSGGLLFFCPLRGRIPAASSPPGRCPGLTYHCPIRGVNLTLIPTPDPILRQAKRLRRLPERSSPTRSLSSTSEATSSITPREGR